jgi:hypothetical protein
MPPSLRIPAMGKVNSSPASLTKAVDTVRMNAPSRKEALRTGAVSVFFRIGPFFSV